MTSACSTQKNTSATRFWHSFKAKYNTYYNGAQAYIDGSLEKENGNRDNYTEMIPLYTVGNKKSRDLGSGNFERAIEKSQKAIHQHSIKRRPVWDKRRRKTQKDIEWLNRREYNPFLWKAWMLMGRSQFHKGDFEDAASTFSYMSRIYQTQPAIYAKARAWLAKSYVELDWMYDAEDVIRNMQRDSIHWKAVKEWDYTYTDYYIHLGDYETAITYLHKVIKHEMRRKQKAREWFLMGQLEAALGHRDLAYKAFQHVTRLHPPYELEFNARIAMTEVMASTDSKKMVSILKRMAANDNNKEYLDQVYYAIGNIHLAQKDTASAISAYEKGNVKSTRNGIEKGVLLLRLGDLYWEKGKYGDAKRCYGEAIGLLDKERDDYEQLSYRSVVLDELVPYTDAIHLQDSLQNLAKMDEKSRNEAIDRVIEALKKKEKEERDKQAEANAQQVQAQNGGMTDSPNTSNTNAQTSNNQKNALWYFYNPTAVSQGKATFQRQWGKRENVDNWQRINQTVVANLGGAEEMTDEQRDSLARAAEKEDSIKNITELPENDPHKREYYLAQIPFTEEARAASDEIIKDALYHAGVIFKDKLDNLTVSEKHLRRLVDQYPDYEHMDDAYYHLFLLYSRMGRPEMANHYLNLMKQHYPSSQWTEMLTDPHFEQNARFGVQMEDSLYAATYNAFRAGRYAEVRSNARLSESRFPLGANRDKFIFIGGLSKLNDGDADGCLRDMKTVVENYPNSDLSQMAGMIVNGVNEGRKLRGGHFDMGDVWGRRTAVMADSDSIAARTFVNERTGRYVFMFVYQPDSVNENQLLFELAKYNFTSYLVRDFEIAIEDIDGLHRMRVNGFRSFDEALQYARSIQRQRDLIAQITNCRAIIISEQNLELLGTQYSYDDYTEYYLKHFAPLKISTFQLLTDPDEVVTEPTPPTIEEIDRALDDKDFIDTGLDVPAETVPPTEENNETVIPVENEPTEPVIDNNTTVVPVEPEPQQPVIDNNTTIVPVENEPTEPVIDNNTTVVPVEPEPQQPVIDNNTTIVPVENEPTEPVIDNNTTVVPVEPEPQQPVIDNNTTIIPVETEPQKPVIDDNTTVIPVESKPVETPKTQVAPKSETKTSTTKSSATTTKSSSTTTKSSTSTSKPSTTKSATSTSTTEKKQTQQKQKQQTTQQKPKQQNVELKPKRDDTGIYFDDDDLGVPTQQNTNDKKKKEPQQQNFDIEDEYYELDGF